MPLRPLRVATPPAYPPRPRRRARGALRRAVATASAVAALWASGCGDDGGCPTRLGGEAPPTERLGGGAPVPADDPAPGPAAPPGPLDGTSVAGPLVADLPPGDRPPATPLPPAPEATPPAKPPEPQPVEVGQPPPPPLPIDRDVPRLPGRRAMTRL